MWEQTLNWLEKSVTFGLLYQMLITFFVLMCLLYLTSHIRRRLKKLDDKHPSFYRKTLIHAFFRPFKALLWVQLLFVWFGQIFTRFDFEKMAHVFAQLQVAVIIVFVGLILLRWRRYIEKSWLDFNESNEVFPGLPVYVAGKLTSVAIIVLTGISLLQNFNINLSAVLAVGGIGVAAIGLASKDVLANFFSGFMIHITRPFGVGDWISSPDKNIEGTVEQIGWYLTKIRSFEKRPIYVPNAIFSNFVIVNPSRMTNRRIKEVVGVRYGDVHLVADIISDIKVMLKAHPAIDQNLTMLVNFMAFGPSSLDILIYTFTKTVVWAEWLDQQQDVFLKIAQIIEARGAEIAYPTRTLDIPKEIEQLGPELK